MDDDNRLNYIPLAPPVPTIEYIAMPLSGAMSTLCFLGYISMMDLTLEPVQPSRFEYTTSALCFSMTLFNTFSFLVLLDSIVQRHGAYPRFRAFLSRVAIALNLSMLMVTVSLLAYATMAYIVT